MNLYEEVSAFESLVHWNATLPASQMDGNLSLSNTIQEKFIIKRTRLLFYNVDLHEVWGLCQPVDGGWASSVAKVIEQVFATPGEGYQKLWNAQCH